MNRQVCILLMCVEKRFHTVCLYKSMINTPETSYWYQISTFYLRWCRSHTHTRLRCTDHVFLPTCSNLFYWLVLAGSFLCVVGSAAAPAPRVVVTAAGQMLLSVWGGSWRTLLAPSPSLRWAAPRSSHLSLSAPAQTDNLPSGCLVPHWGRERVKWIQTVWGLVSRIWTGLSSGFS